jgi:murein DD-endopeptidase MepM/ murein hydrolase activator NlpD
MAGTSDPIKIQKGDTLSGIAKRYGVTIQSLMDANPDIKDANKIKAGKTLVLGANKKQGESIYSKSKPNPESNLGSYDLDDGDVRSAKAGGLVRRAKGGALGCGAATKGFGAVRKK